MSTLRVLASRPHVAAFYAESARRSPQGVVLGLEVVAWGELRDALLRSAFPKLRVLSPFQHAMALRCLLREEAGVASPLLGTAALRALGELLDREETAEENAEGLFLEATQLQRWRESWQARCEAGRWMSRAAAHQRLPKALAEGAALPERVLQAKRIVVDAAPVLEDSDIVVLEALAARLRGRAEVMLELPHGDEESFVFAYSERWLRRLEAGAEQGVLQVIPVQPAEQAASYVETGAGAGGRAPLGERVLEGLGGRNETKSGQGEGADSVSTGSASLSEGVTAEVVFIEAASMSGQYRALARQVRRWIEQGFAPEAIAIASARPERHHEGMRAALVAQGLELREHQGRTLASLPLLRWLLRLLRLHFDAWPRDGLAEVLGSAYLRSYLRAFEGLSPWRARRLLLSVPARGGHAHAQRGVLDGLRALPQRSSGHEALIAALESLQARVAALFTASTLSELAEGLTAFVDEVVDTAPWRTGATYLLRLLERERSAIESLESDAIAQTRLASEAFAAVVSSLREIDAGGFTLPRLWQAEGLLAILRDAFELLRLPTQAPPIAAVHWMPLREVAGRRFEGLAVLGLNEGELPCETQGEDGGSERQAWWLGLGLAGVEQGLALCHASYDEGARPSAASPWWNVLRGSLCAGDVVWQDIREEFGLPRAPDEAAGSEEVLRSWMVERSLSFDEEAWRAAEERWPVEAEGAASGLAALPERGEHRAFSSALDAEQRALLWALAARERRRLRAQYDDVGVRPLPAPPPSFGSLERPLSVSALESYARCPFQFYARYVLKWRDEDKAEEERAGCHRWQIAHVAVEAAMRVLIAEDCLPYLPELAARARDLAAAAAEQRAREALAERALDKAMIDFEARWLAERVATLVETLYLEGDGFEIVDVELPFGSAETPLFIFGSAEGEGVHLQGRIDLVERKSSTYRVVDLKTAAGLTTLNQYVGDALRDEARLQLPVYAAALRQRYADAEEVDARYFSLSEAKASHTLSRAAEKKNAPPLREWTAFRNAAGAPTALASEVLRLSEGIRAGHFPVRPREEACATCDVQSLCRVSPRNASEVEE